MVTTGETSAGSEPSPPSSPPGQSAIRRAFSFLAAVLLSIAVGGALAAVVVGVIVKSVPLFCGGLGGLLAAVLLVAVPGRARRRVLPVPRTALARIESRRATNGEFADVPVRFDLTVAPEDAPAYRVGVTEAINLVDLTDYPEGRIVVVTYHPAEPWTVELVRRPPEEWARWAAEARIDTAPEETRVKEPREGWAWCSLILLGLLAGAAVVVLLCWGRLSDGSDDRGDTPPSPSASGFAPGERAPAPSAGSTTVSTVTGSASSTSTLRPGEMRRLANTLATGMGTEFGTRITIEEKVMSAVGAKDPFSGGAFPMSLRAVPYELLPGLVDSARTGLGIDSPASWRIDITVKKGGPEPVVRVTVSGHGRSAYLLADAVGRITERHAD